MRLFFALPLDERDRIAIADWRARMFPPLDRPIPPQNMHLTLAFLGEVKPARREPLEMAASRVQSGPITLHIDQLGYFSKPGILWVGPAETPVRLTNLARQLDSAARRVGIRTEEREYQPHITLARRCQVPPPASALPPDFTMRFEYFTLFESVGGRRGVHYHPLAEWPLA